MSGITTANGLIAPPDALRFALAYLIIVIIPGYALAKLARPKAPRIEHIALAIPCTYGLVASSGLATVLLHLPFGLRAYAILAVPITVAALYCTWRHRTTRSSNRINWWSIIPIAVALVQTSMIAVVYGRDAVPPGPDVTSHISWAETILHSHIFPIALLSSHIGSSEGGFYPPVFHALTAMLLAVVPMAGYRAVFYSVVATTILLPLGLFAYVRVATGSEKLGGLAALTMLAFAPLPFFLLALSSYTLIVALLIAPALAISLHRGLGEGERRSVALAAILGIGLFYTHPTEYITAALLALAIVPSVLRNRVSWFRACGYLCMLVVAWGASALPALAAVRHTMVTGAQSEIQAGHLYTRPAQIHLLAVAARYVNAVYLANLNYLLLAATSIGAVWCLSQRRFLGLVAVQIMLCLVFLDANTYNVLQRVYVLAYPWAQPERLAATHYLFALPMAAIGIDVASRAVWKLLRRKSVLLRTLVVCPSVLLGVVLPLDATVIRAAQDNSVERFIMPSDLGAIAWLSRHVSPDAVVVNDASLYGPANSYFAIDAGIWMPVLGVPQPLFWRFSSGPGTVDDRLYLLRHIADVPLPRRAAHFIAIHRVQYVFYGPKGADTWEKRHLNLSHLLEDPDLRLAYASTNCHYDGPHKRTLCPATGSYVFALIDTN